LRVRYSECDAQKVVFNGRYGEYVDLAVTEYMRAIGLTSGGLFVEFDYQLVKQTIEWRAPARFDDVFEISFRRSISARRSFTSWSSSALRQRIPHHDGGNRLRECRSEVAGEAASSGEHAECADARCAEVQSIMRAISTPVRNGIDGQRMAKLKVGILFGGRSAEHENFDSVGTQCCRGAGSREIRTGAGRDR